MCHPSSFAAFSVTQGLENYHIYYHFRGAQWSYFFKAIKTQTQSLRDEFAYFSNDAFFIIEAIISNLLLCIKSYFFKCKQQTIRVVRGAKLWACPVMKQKINELNNIKPIKVVKKNEQIV